MPPTARRGALLAYLGARYQAALARRFCCSALRACQPRLGAPALASRRGRYREPPGKTPPSPPPGSSRCCSPRGSEQPAGRDPRMPARFFLRDQERQLERLSKTDVADLLRRRFGDEQVPAFQRSPEDRPRMGLRGRPRSSPGPRRRSELKRHSPTRGGGSPKAPAGQAAVLPSSALFRGSDPSQLSHLVIPVARGCKSGPELVCMPLPAPGERAGSPQNVLATSHLRGKRLSWAHTMICVSRGPAFGPCGWPNASGGERMTAAPALEHFCPAPRQVQGSSAHQRLEVVAGPGPGCVVVQNYERKMRLFRVSRSVVADINPERAGRELPRWGRSGRHP
jgi:hypothetical protein